MKRHGITFTASLVFVAGLLASGCSGRLRQQAAGNPEVAPGFSPSPTCRYFYNRKELHQSVLAGERLVALTSSGTLLSFDRQTFRLEAEHAGQRITHLAWGEGNRVLAILEDRQMVEIEPRTLRQRPIGKLPAGEWKFPRWIGQATLAGESTPRPVALLYGEVVEIEGGKTYSLADPGGKCSGVCAFTDNTHLTLMRHPSVAMADSGGRLWLGEDNGEWGGWAGWLDLATGKLHSVKTEQGENFGGNVIGFAELRDGRILVFGGLNHLTSASTYIGEILDGRLKMIYHRLQDSHMEDLAESPRYPITQIHQDAKTGALYVFTGIGVFKANESLSEWRRVATLKLRDGKGGTGGEIRAVHPVGGGFILATEREGYLNLTLGGEQRISPLPGDFAVNSPRWLLRSPDAKIPWEGKFEVTDPVRIVKTSRGTILWEVNEWGERWRLVDNRWEPLGLEPPVGIRQRHDEWATSILFVAHDGTLYTVNATRTRPGQLAIIRWRDGKPTILAAEADSSIDPSRTFMTPDGTFWVLGPHGDLLHLGSDGTWDTAGSRLTSFPERASAISSDRPPWILLTPRGELTRLSVKDGKHAVLDGIDVKGGGGKFVRVTDAVAWPAGRFLLATDAGLRALDPSTGAVTPANLPAVDDQIRVLGRDGLGRLWLGGESVWVVDGDGTKVRKVDCQTTGIGRSAYAMGPDAGHEDTMLVSLPGGLAMIRVPR